MGAKPQIWTCGAFKKHPSFLNKTCGMCESKFFGKVPNNTPNFMNYYKQMMLLTLMLLGIMILGYFAYSYFEQKTVSDSPLFMSFGACDIAEFDCTKPENHLTYIAQSQDGTNWDILPNWEPFYGSVPDIIIRDNILYIYTAGKAGSLTTYDLKTQKIVASKHVDVEGIDGFADPAPYLDENGNIVLFFLYCRLHDESVPCFTQSSGSQTISDAEKEHIIGSATEIQGTHGSKFTLDPGDRADVTNGGTDPDIFYDGEQFVMYVSYGQNFSVFTSDSLHGTYENVPYASQLFFSRNNGGVPSGYFDKEAQLYYSYAHKDDPSTSISVIYFAKHGSIETPLQETDWTIVFDAQDLGLSKTTRVESPGILYTK